MSIILLRRLALTTLFAMHGTAAMAQYVWQDEQGVRQYSDKPPPDSVPQNRILKSPSIRVAAPAAAAPTLAERELDFQKRRAEAAEKQKKDEEKAKQDAQRSQNCARLAEYGRALASGERIRRTTSSGERAYMDDAERKREIQANRRALEACR